MDDYCWLFSAPRERRITPVDSTGLYDTSLLGNPRPDPKPHLRFHKALRSQVFFPLIAKNRAKSQDWNGGRCNFYEFRIERSPST